MRAIATLEWDIRAADTTLEVTGGSINIDDQNVPAITASVVVPFDAAVLAALDPRQTNVPRVVLNGSLSEWASRPISFMTEYAQRRGPLISDLSAAWSGDTIEDVSLLFGAPLSSSASNEPLTMSLDLHVREIDADDFEMRIQLASDEALLLDWSVTGLADIDAFVAAQSGLNAAYASTYINMTLAVVLGYTTPDGPYRTDPVSSEYEFSIVELAKGMTAWEIVRGALDDADLKLRVNPTGRGFTLQRPENSINNPATHAHFWAYDEVIEARQVYSRTGDWYDSAMLRVDGVPSRGHPNGEHSRTYLEDLPVGSKPTLSAAQNIVRRAQNRGRFIDLVVPIKPGVFMRDEFTYETAAGELQPWIVKAVTYDLAAATMNIRGEHRY